jgi:TrmH family RNA methyltransferase
MQIISSKDNECVKHIKKLKDKKYRDINKEFVIEGIKLIKEAIEEKAEIKKIVICDNCQNADIIPKQLMYEIARYECIYVTENIFKSISDVNTPQGILAIIGINATENEIDYSQDIIVALDDIQDPGNLGTILRTVDSIGLNQILVSKGTADSYNPKVVRSTMGAIFRVKIIECENLEKTLYEVQKHKFQLVITSLQTQNSIYDIDYNKKVIVIGNEANGVEQNIQKIADIKVKIPMIGKTESLNASVATGIVLYEYVRQKLKKS